MPIKNNDNAIVGTGSLCRWRIGKYALNGKMDNRRRYKRYKVDIMQIDGRIILARHVEVLDMSLGGISLLIDRKINIESEFTLNIEGKGPPLLVDVIVVWSFLTEYKNDTEGGVLSLYKVGMRFTDSSDEEKQEIADFIEAHKKGTDGEIDLFSSSVRRLYARVPIETPAKSMADVQEKCRVKVLSFGGMLIESRYALEIESRLPMELNLPGKKTIKFLGRAASCLTNGNTKQERYDIGIEFLDMSEQHKQRLKEFVDSLSQ
jgi:c-di-GMP-binding flagellar brake protein YcgR